MPPAKDNKEAPEAQPEVQEPDVDGAAAFWEALDKRLDAAFERRAAKTPPPAPDKPQQGTSRTGSKRTTLPGLIADIVFGPPKED